MQKDFNELFFLLVTILDIQIAEMLKFINYSLLKVSELVNRASCWRGIHLLGLLIIKMDKFITNESNKYELIRILWRFL